MSSNERPQREQSNNRRLPPHSLESEQGVIGCMLLDPPSAIPETVARLKETSDFFYDLRHRTIYDTLVEMSNAGDPIDLITIQQRLKDSKELEAVGGISYISSLIDSVPSAANLSWYLETLVEKFALRRTIQYCTEIVGSAYEHEGWAAEFLDRAERQILEIGHLLTADVEVTVKDLVHEAINFFEDCLARQGQLTGLSTGYPDLDKMTSGLRNGDMVVLAARPSVGKSSVAMNIAEHVAVDQKIPVGVFSLEMTKQSLVQRMICSRARINMRNLTEGKMAERDLPRMSNAAGAIAKAPIYIDDTSALSILQLRARARRMFQRYKVRMLVIDYLQLMNSPKAGRNDNRVREVSDISNGVKQLAKELNIPVLVLSQLNREIEKDKKQRAPRLSDLRDSGSIEQDADVVAFLHSTAEEEAKSNDVIPVRMSIAKQRSGPTGGIDFTFMRAFTRFESAAKVSAADMP